MRDNYNCPIGMYDSNSGKCYVDGETCTHRTKEGNLARTATRCGLANEILGLTGEIDNSHEPASIVQARREA